MSLPNDPGPGANPGKPEAETTIEYLDLTERVEGQPAFMRYGPVYAWEIFNGKRTLCAGFRLPNGPTLWRAIPPGPEMDSFMSWLLASGS